MTSFISKIQHFQIITLALHHDTKLFGWKNVYLNEFQQFEPFKCIRKCAHTHVFYLMSKEYTLSSQKELQMFPLITGCHIGGPHGFFVQNSNIVVQSDFKFIFLLCEEAVWPSG